MEDSPIPLDLTLIEFNLALTPEQRIDAHEKARELMQDLRNAGQEFYKKQDEAQSQSST